MFDISIDMRTQYIVVLRSTFHNATHRNQILRIFVVCTQFRNSLTLYILEIERKKKQGCEKQLSDNSTSKQKTDTSHMIKVVRRYKVNAKTLTCFFLFFFCVDFFQICFC